MEKIRFKHADASTQAAYICDATGNQDGEYYRAEDVDAEIASLHEKWYGLTQETVNLTQRNVDLRAEKELLQDERDALRAVVADLEKDWTRGETGGSNSSDAFRSLVVEIDRIIRDGAHSLLNGQSISVAGVVAARLAHMHHMRPFPPRFAQRTDLEKDAARYRWLVRQDFDIPSADRIDDRIARGVVVAEGEGGRKGGG